MNFQRGYGGVRYSVAITGGADFLKSNWSINKFMQNHRITYFSLSSCAFIRR